MYGDSSLRVGEIINFYVPSNSTQEGQENISDAFLSDKYLITKIKHEFTAEKYLMHVQIRKDSWQSDLPAFDQEPHETGGDGVDQPDINPIDMSSDRCIQDGGPVRGKRRGSPLLWPCCAFLEFWSSPLCRPW